MNEPAIVPLVTGRTSGLNGVLAQAIACTEEAGVAQRLAGRLKELRARLASARLQIAVIGQFKRGKSTLMNALVGADILPTGVVPVTAIATFLEVAAEPGLVIIYNDGRREEAAIADVAGLKQRLAELVSEAGNPGNRLNVDRVEARLRSRILKNGLVIIDTPGVGSTLRHNTSAAEAALPACDVALFVVSPDPPITAVEIDYLRQALKQTDKLFVVLNKIDLVAPEDADAAEAYLRDVLRQELGRADAPVFRVSARRALAARMVGDERTVSESGLSLLEARLTRFLAEEKEGALTAAIALKARATLETIIFEIRLALKALALPVEDLDRRSALFEQAVDRFATERRVAADLLAADEKRFLAELDAHSDALRERLVNAVTEDVTRAHQDGAGWSDAWASVRAATGARFEAAFREETDFTRTALSEIFASHQARSARLNDEVRRVAAEIMELAPPEAEASEALSFRREPYWVLERRPSLNPLAPDAVERLLPRGMREREARRRIEAEIHDLAVRNLENVRWALHQDARDTFRAFASELDQEFSEGLETTRGALAIARDKGQALGRDAATETARFSTVETRLLALSDSLAKA